MSRIAPLYRRQRGVGTESGQAHRGHRARLACPGHQVEARLQGQPARSAARRFLREVGVTSQREIERAVRHAAEQGQLRGGEVLKARAIITVEDVGLRHLVEGEIPLRAAR